MLCPAQRRSRSLAARASFLLASQPPFGPLDFAGQALLRGKHAIEAWFGNGRPGRAQQREGKGKADSKGEDNAKGAGGRDNRPEVGGKASAGDHRNPIAEK